MNFKSLQIHSETDSPGHSQMDRLNRGKRKTSESSTPVKENQVKANGEFTPRRSRRKASESSVAAMETNGFSSASAKKKERKISEKSVEESPSSAKKRERKVSEKSIEESPVSSRRERKLSERLNQSRERKNSTNSNGKSADKSPGRTGIKRKTSESGVTEALSVSDRIKLLSHDQNQKSTPPRTDSVLQLLLQGLNDVNIVGPVLERADEELIHDTVKRLPSDRVVPLLTVLHHYIQVIH